MPYDNYKWKYYQKQAVLVLVSREIMIRAILVAILDFRVIWLVDKKKYYQLIRSTRAKRVPNLNDICQKTSDIRLPKFIHQNYDYPIWGKMYENSTFGLYIWNAAPAATDEKKNFLEGFIQRGHTKDHYHLCWIN